MSITITPYHHQQLIQGLRFKSRFTDYMSLYVDNLLFCVTDAGNKGIMQVELNFLKAENQIQECLLGLSSDKAPEKILEKAAMAITYENMLGHDEGNLKKYGALRSDTSSQDRLDQFNGNLQEIKDHIRPHYGLDAILKMEETIGERFKTYQNSHYPYRKQ